MTRAMMVRVRFCCHMNLSEVVELDEAVEALPVDPVAQHNGR
jgi:hypothetical protein